MKFKLLTTTIVALGGMYVYHTFYSQQREPDTKSLVTTSSLDYASSKELPPTEIPVVVSQRSEPSLTDTNVSFSLTNLLRSSTGSSISAGILNGIEDGKISVNQSLKKGDESYTPLLAALALDKDIDAKTVNKFIELGAEVLHTDTWIVIGATINAQPLEALLDNGFDANTRFMGRQVTNLALFAENFEAVDSLLERGFEIEKNWVHQYQISSDIVESEEVDLSAYIDELPNQDSQEKIMAYLKKKGITH